MGDVVAQQARYVVHTVGELLYWLKQTDPSTPVRTADDNTVAIEIVDFGEGIQEVIITDEV